MGFCVEKFLIGGFTLAELLCHINMLISLVAVVVVRNEVSKKCSYLEAVGDTVIWRR